MQLNVVKAKVCLWTGVLAFGPSAHWAQARMVGKIREVRLPVQMRLGQTGIWKQAVERGSLEPGHYIHTGAGGRALLRFTNGTQVALNSNAQIVVEGDDTPAKPLAMRVFGALTQIVVRSRGPMEIRAAAAIAAPRGTEYMVTLTDENTMVLTVAEGSVRFYNAQGEQIVTANQQSTAKTGEAPTKPVAVDASGLMQWAFDVAALPVEFELPARTRGDLTALRATVVANPDDAAAQMALGEALRQSGDANGAVAAYRKAVQLAPTDASRVGLAISLLAHDDLDAARGALAANPTSALELAARGLIQLRSNDTAGALQSLTQAADRDPQSAQAPALLALAHLTQNQTAPAIEAARRAVQLAPNSSQAQSALALALFYAGQTRDASRAAARAVQLNPESPLALLVQGQALLAQHQTDAARAALQQADGLAPDLPLIQLNLGAAYNRLDMPQRAEKAYLRVLDKAPNSAAGHAGLGSVLLSTGRRQEALAELQRALELDPNDVMARANMALYYIEMGDFVGAKKIAGAIGDDPSSGLLYIRLSEGSLFQQKLFEAQEYARKAVRLLPDSAIAHYQLGRVYREQDRTVQAEQEFRQAVILDRQFTEARFALGLAREAAETGRDFNRPLSAIASNASGPRQSLNIQNLQTPGVEDRIQAAIADPSVIRSASRSFGDNQIDGSYGEDNTGTFSLSHLQEINNRRGAFGASLSRDHTDGVRPNADLTVENIGAFGGTKREDNPSGFFALTQFTHSRFGLDTGPVSLGSSALRNERILPFALVGYNGQTKENARTRALLAFDNPKQDGTAATTSFLDTKGRSYHAEVRHDVLTGRTHDLSIGAAMGLRRFDNENFFKTPPGIPVPDFRSSAHRRVNQEQLYARDTLRLSRRLSVAAEMKAIRVRRNVVNVMTSLPGSPIFITTDEAIMGVPNLVTDYRVGRGTMLRFQARGLIGDIEDFDLLAPTDVFLFSDLDLPDSSLLTRGRAYQLELSHQMGAGLLLRIGAFQRDYNAIRTDGGEDMTDVSFRSVRTRLEGSLNKSTTFFLSGDLNDATGTFENLSGTVFPNYQLTRVPKVAVETGVQYLGASGWFVQPSVALIGSRLQADDGAGARAKLGNFGLVNLRIGKRSGLKSTIFVEVANLTNKTYITPGGDSGELQPGRQIRLGGSVRF